jgi:hypothetical protein
MKRVLFCVVLLVHFGALAASAQGVGAISGTVTDESGGVMPGANVTLLSEGVAGGSQQVITDSRGMYQFLRLVPGAYGVRVELSGFRTTTREGIIVSADVTARADVRLAVGALEEGITVTGEAPLLDTTSALNQTVLDRTLLAAIPSRNDLWSIGRAVPSIVMNKYDVGGTEMYANSSATVHGASEGNEGQFMVDGMAVDCGSAAGTTCNYADPFAYQEINYQIGNASAENLKGGIIYNMITRTGTNAFRGDYMFSGVLTKLQSNNITPELRRDLLSGVPPRALAANPGLEPRADIERMFNTAIAFSGPIMQDRLWFAATADYGLLDQFRVGNYNPDGTLFMDDNRRKTYSLKISWQIAPSHQLHAYHQMQDKGALHRTADNPTEFYESRWTEHQTPNDRYTEQTRWTGAMSARVLAEAGASLYWGGQNIYPQPEVTAGDLSAFDSVTRTHMNSRPSYAWISQHRAVLQPSVTISAGRHDVKIGYQGTHGYQHPQNYSFSHFPSGLRAVFRNGVPDSVNTYNTPTSTPLGLMEHALYIQDKWALSRKLTVNAGLRFQTANGGVPARCQVETVFIAGQCWPEQEDVTDFQNFTPRFSIVYDVFGNGMTAVKLSANRYVVGIGTSVSTRLDPIRQANDTRLWTDRNGDKYPQLNELGPSSGYNLGTTNRYADDLNRPHSNEFSASIEHQLPGGIVVSAAYYHRQMKDQIGSRNMAVPTESYTPMVVVERSSGREVTVYNQDPALRGRFDTLWDNFAELDGEYNGVDLNFRKRLSNRWMIMGGASFGHNEGDIYGGGSDLNNPNFAFRRGVLSADLPRIFKASGLYELPYAISMSGSFQYYTGQPERTTVSVGTDSATLTQVTQVITVEPQGTTRLPSVTMIDMSFRKAFRFNNRSVEPSFELFNIGNINTITSRSAQLGPAYGRVSNIIRGRLAKFGLNVRF